MRNTFKTLFKLDLGGCFEPSAFARSIDGKCVNNKN